MHKRQGLELSGRADRSSFGNQQGGTAQAVMGCRAYRSRACWRPASERWFQLNVDPAEPLSGFQASRPPVPKLLKLIVCERWSSQSLKEPTCQRFPSARVRATHAFPPSGGTFPSSGRGCGQRRPGRLARVPGDEKPPHPLGASFLRRRLGLHTDTPTKSHPTEF